MVKDLKEPIIKKIKKNVEHQGIGGLNIIIEKVMILDDVARMNTIGAYNFINRRPDLMSIGLLSDKDIEKIRNDEMSLTEFNKKWNDFLDNFKIYYGHVGGLGYFVAQDELEEDSNEK